MNSNTAKKRFLKASISTTLVASSISAVVTPAAATTFNDLTSTNSHYENILNLLERGVIKGYPDDTYRPNVAVTRGQAAKILAKTLNLNITNVVSPNFTDVQTTDEYYPYIAALVQAGILSGYSDQTFKPTQTITRGQMAKMIALGFQLTNEDVVPFTDISATHQYASYVNALFGAKVTTGKTDSTFDLTGFVTRGQLASFVVRAEQAAKATETTITGSIDTIEDDTVTINGKVLSVNKDVAFLLATANKNALLNAEITFSVKNNEILAIDSLSLKNGDSFDGQNVTIKKLTVAASITSLKNIVADTIQYAVISQVNIENVTAKKLTAQATPGVVASLATTAPVIDLVISGSNFELVQLIGAIASVQKTASTITNLQAEKVTNLQLMGDFKQVLLSALAKLTGTAIIEDIQFVGEPTAAFQPGASVQINNIIINGQKMSWSDMVSQFMTEQANTTSNSGGSGNSSPSQTNDSENTGLGDTQQPAQPNEPGDTQQPAQPDEPGDSQQPAQPDELGDTQQPAQPDEPGDTQQPAQPDEPGDTQQPAQPNEPGDTQQPAQPDEPGDTQQPAQPAEPGDTQQPAQPAEPGDTQQPVEPGDTQQPAQPDEPGDTQQPAEPEQTKTTVTGSISEIKSDKLTINGELFTVTKDVAFLLAATNKNALLNAEITFATQNNEILAITSLSLKNGDSFDGLNAKIKELTVAASITSLKNVVADTIQYAVISQVKIENVSAKKLTAQTTPGLVASLATTAPVIDLVISGSNFEIVQLIGAIASVQKTASTITNLQVEKVSNLQLVGDFKQVLLSALAKLTGKATIEDIQFVGELTATFQPEASVQINSVIVNGQRMSWSDMVNQLTPSQPDDSEKPGDTEQPALPSEPGDTEQPVQPDEPDEPGDTEKPVQPEQPGDTEQPALPSEPGDTEQPALPSEPGDTEQPALPSEPGDTEQPTLPSEPGDTEQPVQPDEPSDTEQPVQPVQPDEPGDTEQPVQPSEPGDTEQPAQPSEPGDTEQPVQPDEPGDTEKPAQPEQPGGTTDPELPSTVAASDITVEGNTIQMTNNETNETVSYVVSNEIQAFFTNNTSLLSNVQIEVVNGEVTGITSATVDANGSTFDGAGIAIGTLTINNASTIANVTSADNLIVSTNAQALTFENVSATTITATGSFSEISGAAGENLLITSTAANVVVSNVTSTNITIAENTNIAQRLAGKRIASVASRFVASDTTSMKITFKDGSYKDQTLVVNRKDTIIDVEGAPFSKITITKDNVNLLANGAEVNRVVLGSDVTLLHLDANVKTFEVTLSKALMIHSSSTYRIDELIVTATATNTDGWLDFVNVSATKTMLNGIDITADTNHAIFKKQVTGAIPTFSSALERTSFGLYKINATNATHYVLVKATDKVEDFTNATTLPANAQTYTAGSSFILHADVTDVVVYNVEADALKGVSVAAAPDDLALVRLNRKTAAGDLTFFTRFTTAQTPSEKLKTIHVFKNGVLSKSTNVTGAWSLSSTGLNSVTVKTGVTLNGSREVIIGNNILASYGADVTTYEADYVKILKNVAQLAAQTNDTNILNETLKYVFSKTEGTYNSYFLSKYVEAINTKGINFTTLSEFEGLITETNEDNKYTPDPIVAVDELYLEGSIQNNFTYSKTGVITNTVNDQGQLLFNAVTAGTTILRVSDSTGLATLVQVTVSANLSISYEVLAIDAPVGTLLKGAEHFRYDDSKLIATAFNQDNNALANVAAIIQENNSTSTLTRVTLLAANNSYALPERATITPTVLSPLEFGLNEITTVTSKNIGYKVISPTEVMFYPQFEGTELMYVGDGTKEVAVDITTTTAITDLADSIARSEELTIGSHLNLLSVNEAIFSGDLPKNVFLYQNGSTVRIFAKDVFTGSVKLVDSANTITLANVTATKVGNKVTPTVAVVKTTLANVKDVDDNLVNENATIVNIDTSIVRKNGLDLYAIGTGTATVTLSNGNQYLVHVGALNGVYTITFEAVKNLNITAAELHMSDIKEVLGASSVQYVKNNSEAVITLADTTEAVLTFLSTNNEKTMMKVTKTGTTYTTEPYRTEITDNASLGLGTLTDVYSVGTTQSATRAKVENGTLYIYNSEPGTRTFRVTDGTKSTVLNVDVKVDGTSVPVAVTHTIPDGYTIDGAVTHSAVHLKGKVLYATGQGLNSENKATIEVPLDNGSNYVIGLTYDPDTGLYSFDQTATVTFTFNYDKEALGLDTITSATTNATNLSASAVDNQVKVAVTGDASGRIEVIGTHDGKEAKTMIYITRTGAVTTDNIERSEKSNVDVALDLDLKGYGYTTTPTGSWTVASLARATISSDFKVNFYALNAGKTGFTLTDADGKKLLMNVTVADTNPRTVTAVAVEETLAGVATIIEGNGVRLSEDKKTIYATTVNGSAKLKLHDGSYVLYEVAQNADGQFTLTATLIANIKAVTATDLGLTGNLIATNLDTTIVTKTEYADSIVLTGLRDGQTAMLVTDASGNTALVNVEVSGNTVTAEKVAPVTATAVPTLLPNEPTSVVRIDGTTIHPVSAGVVRLLIGNEIQEVTVTNTDGHFAITGPTTISKAVIPATDLGFSTNAALEIETPTNANFYVNQLDGQILAYSKLTGQTTGSFEFVVKATDTGARTVIRLNDKGTDFEFNIAKKVVTFTGIANVIVDNTTIARLENGTVYAVTEGFGFAADTDGYLHAVDITRDTDGYLDANVRPLAIDGETETFTKLTGTDENIIKIDGSKLYAKQLGITKVKLGTKVLTVTIGKDATGKYTIKSAETTSQFVPFTAANVADFETIEVIAGTANAVSLSKETDGLTIFSNGATNAQSLLLRVTASNDDQALINVTLDENGAVSKAEVVAETITVTESATQSLQTAKVRGVWNDKSLTIYPLVTGDTSLAFPAGLVNISATADGLKVNKPTITMIDHNFLGADTITNADLMNNSYFIAEGSALVYKDGKVFSASVSKVNVQYVKQISDGSNAVEIDLTTIGGTFAQDKSALNSVGVLDVAATDTLVLYADGVGISDITITTSTGDIVYQTNVTATAIDTPKLAEDTLTGDFAGAVHKEGDSVRLEGNTIYFLKEGATTLVKDTKLINVNVTRDANGYFTATPAFVTATLKEAYTGTTGTDYIADGLTLYATTDVPNETFYTNNYRVVATTTKTDGLYSLSVEERHMKKFVANDYFAPGAAITVKENKNANVARAEVVDGELIIYAWDAPESTLITFTDGTKDVVFNVVRNTDGEITATPQAAVDSLKFDEIGLTATPAITISNEFDTTVAEVTATSTGLTVNALKAGTTSVALEQNGAVVGLVNIKVDSINGVLKITSTAVSYDVTNPQLVTTMSSIARTVNGKSYATSTGKTLYGAGANATLVVVSQNATTGLYSAAKTTHTLATIDKDTIHLNGITHASVNGSTVEVMTNADNSIAYIYGTNNGTSDVVLSNGTQHATIVAANGATLVATPASKALETADQFTGANWVTNFVEIRGQHIYATHAGKGVATADLSTHKVLMNIEVARKTDQTFDIKYDVVDDNQFASATTMTILDGTSIELVSNRIFAQELGTSTIQVDTAVYTVEVTKSADGFYTLKVSEPVAAQTISADDLGLGNLTKTTIVAITGAGVVEAKIINNELVLQAKSAGEAQITVTDGTSNTIVHALVINENGKLLLTPTIAKEALVVAPLPAELAAIQADGIFRTVDKVLFAVKEGELIAALNGELHKFTATKVDNVLTPTASKITATLLGAVTLTTTSTVVKTDGNQVIATGFGTELVKVDGSRTFRITVNTDGTIVSEELVADSIDLINILNTVTSELTVTSPVAKATYNGTTVTFDPIAAGTETMIISDGTNAIQIKVTVTDTNGTLNITTEIPSKKLYTGILGLFPTSVTMPNDDAFTSQNGTIKLKDGEITVYPGAVGTAQLILTDANGKTALYELTVNADYSYSFAPYTQTVGYDAFKFNPEIFKKVGTALAKVGVTGLDVSFDDTNETIFIVKGDAADYKVLIVQAEIDKTANSFAALTPKVFDAHTVTGVVSNVHGLQLAKDEATGTSILFVDSKTTYPASYTVDGVIYNVVENTDPAIPKQIVATSISQPQKPGTTYTSGVFVQGIDVASFEDGKWTAKQEGMGIYRTDTGYVPVTVTKSNNTYTITEDTALQQVTLDSSLTNVQVLAPLDKVYVDVISGATTMSTFGANTQNTITIFGDSVEKIVVSAEKDGEKILYSGKFTDVDGLKPIKTALADTQDPTLGLLGWKEFNPITTLNAVSSILRIKGNEIYAVGIGTENITFTSPNGLQRTLQIEVTSDYEIKLVEPVNPNVITYVADVPGEDISSITFTFHVNIPANLTVVPTGVVGGVEIYDNHEIVMEITPGIQTKRTFTIKFPELGEDPVEFTISATDLQDYIISATNPIFRFDKVTEHKDFTQNP